MQRYRNTDQPGKTASHSKPSQLGLLAIVLAAFFAGCNQRGKPNQIEDMVKRESATIRNLLSIKKDSVFAAYEREDLSINDEDILSVEVISYEFDRYIIRYRFLGYLDKSSVPGQGFKEVSAPEVLLEEVTDVRALPDGRIEWSTGKTLTKKGKNVQSLLRGEMGLGGFFSYSFKEDEPVSNFRLIIEWNQASLRSVD